ncbi:hypothetical protein E5K00_02720 [Hymenobacter aquaticus]|uniref:Uncharacterized protein n=1 Tax=Hymenobacter aquaticus TaxID=1867101 RepID=A0A4Z0Q362_9BACT|nr:hypothetical protein [Hymenobacter aquaticus]TGE24145.1 hypothetical protein E5K00_02720 [Hymenobacter aquaticus]
MSLIPLFPDLQAISRSLRQYQSILVFRYSETSIRMQPVISTSANQRYALLAGLAFGGVFCLVAIMQSNYIVLGMVLLLGLFVVWREYRARKSGPDIKIIRLQNEVEIDIVARRITVEHLHPYFRQHVAETTVAPFAEILNVVACRGRSQSEDEYYGELYLSLTDDSRLYLIEVDSESVARSIARLLQQVLGLPVDPEPTSWWQF